MDVDMLLPAHGMISLPTEVSPFIPVYEYTMSFSPGATGQCLLLYYTSVPSTRMQCAFVSDRWLDEPSLHHIQ